MGVTRKDYVRMHPEKKPSTRQRLQEEAELLAPGSWFLSYNTLRKYNSVVYATGPVEFVMGALADHYAILQHRYSDASQLTTL